MHAPTEIRQRATADSTVDAINERGETVPTAIAGEHPLTLYLDKRELVTLMTLGAAPEHLALGYLRNQRSWCSVAELAAVQVDWDVGPVAITSRRCAHRHHALGASRHRADLEPNGSVGAPSPPAAARARCSAT